MRVLLSLGLLTILLGAVMVPTEASHTEPVRGVEPIASLFGGSLQAPLTRVLLVPPTHGDLGNLEGPSGLDYLEATLAAIHAWEMAIDLFIVDYPQFSYLDEISIEVEVYDQQVPPSAVGYDIVAGFVESGAGVFRGLAWGPFDTQSYINLLGVGDTVHYANRYAVISLFSNAPRAHQHIPDYPELNDIHTVVMHEFAHTFGLGHTTTWTAEHGPDLMNSPYTAVYGDGDPLGDGGERTPALCASSLDLYGLAYLYRWLPDGEWTATRQFIESPLPYELYCV